MHVVFRESHGLEDTDTPYDPGQTPADLVVLSFSDSDLGAFAAGWHRGGGKEGKLPSETHSVKYALEYGDSAVEVHTDAIVPGQRVLVLDDDDRPGDQHPDGDE